MFALREEYLAPLEPYVDWIPTRWTNTFRLDLLDGSAVLEVLQRTAAQGGRTFAEPAARALFADLARTQVQQPDGSFREETGRHAEPVQLQVACRRLWDAMPADDRSIDPEDLTRFGDVSQALGAYYAEAIARIAGQDQALERRIRSWFGERLIAPGGIRGQVLRGAESSDGLPNSVIEKLLDTHLIRGEKRAGATWYELAHDRLIAPVQASNAGWLDAHLECFQQQAALWVQRGRPASGGDQLLRGRTLDDALRFQRTSPALVSEDEERLIGISQGARRVRRWTGSILALVVVLVLAFAGTAWWLKDQADQATDQAQQKEREAWFQVAEGHRKDAVSARDSDPLKAAHYYAHAAWRFAWARSPKDAANALLALKFINDRPLLQAAMGHEGGVNGAAFSADGRRILTWGGEGSARVWDSGSGAPLTPPLKHGDLIDGAGFDADGTSLVTWSAGTMRRWDSLTGEDLGPLLRDGESFGDAELSADGSRLLTWNNDGTARLWDTRTGGAVTPPIKHEGSLRGAQLGTDNTRILTWAEDGTGRVWDGTTGGAVSPTFRLVEPGEIVDEFLRVDLSRDASRVLAWTRRPSRQPVVAAQLWDSRTGTALTKTLNHDQRDFGARFSTDGSILLTWSSDNAARLWDAQTGRDIAPPLKHAARVRGARFDPYETRILTWSDDGTARLWSSRTGEAVAAPLKHDKPVSGAQFSADGSRILTWSEDGTARLWDSETGEMLLPQLMHGAPMRGARFSPDESLILTWGEDNAVRVWDTRSDRTPPLIKLEGPINGTLLKVDGSRILTWTGRGSVAPLDDTEHGAARLWDSKTGEALTPPLRHDDAVEGAQFNADETRILTWSRDGTARIWDSRAGKALTPPLRHRGSLYGAQFSPDASRVLTWSEDRTAGIWDSRTGEALTPPLHHDGSVSGAQFSPDGSEVLTLSEDDTIRFWNSRTGKALGSGIKHGLHGLWAKRAQYGAAGSQVLIWGSDDIVRLWDTRTGEPLDPVQQPLVNGLSPDQFREPFWDGTDSAWLRDNRTGELLTPALKHRDTVLGARLSPEGTRILTWSRDGSARLWETRTGAALTPSLDHAQTLYGNTGAEFSGNGSRFLTWSEDGTVRLWDIAIDTQWPFGKQVLKVEVETGTTLTPTGEVKALTPAKWHRKRFCEYDAIRHDLKRLTDAEWAESERRCKALDQPEQPRAPPPTAGAAGDADGY